MIYRYKAIHVLDVLENWGESFCIDFVFAMKDNNLICGLPRFLAYADFMKDKPRAISIERRAK